MESKDKFVERLDNIVYEPIFKDVEKIIFDKIGYDIDMLKVKSNSQGYVYPRMIFSYLCKEKGLTIERIGKKINRNHATISFYLKNFESYYKSDKIFKILVDVIVKDVNNGK